MEYIVTAEEMKRCDNNTSTYFGISSLVLMERAALAVVEEIKRCAGEKKHVLVVAGSGNNGGDGIAVARMLMLDGFQVDVALLGERERCSAATKTQLEIYEKYGGKVMGKIPACEYDSIIDAIFGIGLNRIVTGDYQQAIMQINQKQGFKIAVDIPSGIQADTGEILGCCIKADMTITFAFQKRGLLLYPGTAFCGKIVRKEIGITKESFLGEKPLMYSYQADDIERLPKRKKSGNKGSFGKILVIAGSVDMSGACILAGLSAYRCGAGLVKMITPQENREILQKTLPEAVLQTYKSGSGYPKEELLKMTEWADSIAVGPGIGTGEDAYGLVDGVLSQTAKPVVLDADALNLVATHEELKQKVRENTEKGAVIIMTPHMGELKRLTGVEIEALKSNIAEQAYRYQEEMGVYIACKDARTVCCGISQEGVKQLYINQSGNDGMATAGAGDVLTGVIVAMLTQGMHAFEAMCLGVFLHGLAGDLAAEKSNHYFMMASDIIEQLKYILGKQIPKTGE